MGYDLIRFVGEIDEEFQCSICSMVFENPVETPCDHAFCSECITRWLSNEAVCPIDRTPLSVTELERLSRGFRNLLAKLNIKCDYAMEGCRVTVELGCLETHLLNCMYSPNSEITCDKGCKGKIYRRELATHNCFEYFSSLVSLKNVEITNLTSALDVQKEKCRKLTCELNDGKEKLLNLQLAIIDRDAQITEFMETPVNMVDSWKISKNEEFRVQSNILEYFIGDEFGVGHVQVDCSYYFIYTYSFKVEVLSGTGFLRIGIASRDHQIPFPNSNNFSSYITNDFCKGDIIEFEIKDPHFAIGYVWEASVYFSKNGNLLKAESIQERDGNLFPTISLAGRGIRVRVQRHYLYRKLPLPLPIKINIFKK